MTRKIKISNYCGERICKYCGEWIPRGEVWNPDQNGNGYHHACLINMQLDEDEKRVKRLAQNSILDKVRAEIEGLQTYKIFEGEKTVYIECDDVLAIINKYKAESGDKCQI